MPISNLKAVFWKRCKYHHSKREKYITPRRKDFNRVRFLSCWWCIQLICKKSVSNITQRGGQQWCSIVKYWLNNRRFKKIISHRICTTFNIEIFIETSNSIFTLCRNLKIFLIVVGYQISIYKYTVIRNCLRWCRNIRDNMTLPVSIGYECLITN